MVIVSLTSAALVYEEDLRLALQPYQTIVPQKEQFLPPSQIAEKVITQYEIDGISSVIYRGANRTAIVPWYGDRDNMAVHLVNPYTGEGLKKQYLAKHFKQRMRIEYSIWLKKIILISRTINSLFISLTGKLEFGLQRRIRR